MDAAQRIEQLRELLEREGLDATVVRSTTDLMWLTGFESVFDTEQAHTAVITQDRCIIHTDSRYSSAMRVAAADERLWEVDDERTSAPAFVARALKDAASTRPAVAIDAATPLSLYRAFSSALPHARLVERADEILALRRIKSPEEVERLKAAQAIAEDAFLEVAAGLRPGLTEVEIALQLEFAMRSRGAQELAFASIVASGPNSANPHAIPSKRELQRGDLVVFDFGARLDGYRSDTTRMVSIGAPTAQQRSIYDAARLANETVAAQIRPGWTGKQAHELAESILADAGFENKMGHGLGHGVGLDIHEQPNLSPRYDKPLPEGCVITIEPGVYLPGEDGVRLEDCGQLTAAGFVNFCSLSHELLVIE